MLYLVEVAGARAKGQAIEGVERLLIGGHLGNLWRCEGGGPDVKAEALLDLLQQQQREENDPALKALIFTEFVPTQAMLSDFLEKRGFSVVSLNGSMDLEERRERWRALNEKVTTNTAGRFCTVFLNYLGRVDAQPEQPRLRAVS